MSFLKPSLFLHPLFNQAPKSIVYLSSGPYPVYIIHSYFDMVITFDKPILIIGLVHPYVFTSIIKKVYVAICC